MNFALIEKLRNQNRVILIFSSLFLFSACISAQDNSSQTNSSQKAPPDVSSKQPTEDSTKFQSVKSCIVLQLPTGIFDNGFEPLGGYQIIGGKPVEFADFDNFTLDKVFEKNAASETNKIVGGVVIDTGKASSDTYQIEKYSISPHELGFSTEVLNGIHYEFKGRFLRTGNFSRFNEKNIPVLEGALKKFNSEKLAAEKNFKFKFNVWKARFPVPNC